MKYYIILGGLITGLLAVWGYGEYKYYAGQADCAAKVNAATVKAAEAARHEERQKQEEINALLQNQITERDTVNARLADDLAQLRNERASRRHLPETPQADCQGTTGADLSAEDAEFLVREAARADRLRSALKACYQYADKIAH